jgi:hypothetical protein
MLVPLNLDVLFMCPWPIVGLCVLINMRGRLALAARLFRSGRCPVSLLIQLLF